jgi:GT2 family glycosyltransferase
MQKVTIAILTYNRSNLLLKLLEELLALKYRRLEILVIDNHSVDDTQNIVRKEFQGVRYYRTNKNIGASARNIGIEKASGNILIALDDDVRGITDKEIHEIVDLFEKHSRLGAVNFKIKDHETLEICNWVHHRRQDVYSSSVFKTYEITEGAVAFRRSALLEIGGYSECFFLSHEGPDLAFRLMNNFYDVIYSPKIEVIHYHSLLGRNNWTNYYYDNRNVLWLAARNFPFSYAIFYIAKGLASMLAYSIRDGFFKYWLSGLYDGLKGLPEVMRERSPLKRKTIKMVKEIDSHRPGFFYLLKKRLPKNGIRL